MNNVMEKDRELYQGGTRSFELRALFYELPYLVAALAAGGAVGAVYALVVIYFRDRFEPVVALYILMALVFCGLLLVFWGASYYPVRVKVFPDRLWFKMMFGRRELYWKNIAGLRPLSETDTRRTLIRPGYRSLCPAISGAVLIERTRGRPWVICLWDREAFLEAVKKLEPEDSKEVSKGSE